jgi:hypothetical protein
MLPHEWWPPEQSALQELTLYNIYGYPSGLLIRTSQHPATLLKKTNSLHCFPGAQVFLLLAEHLAQWGTSASFPESSHPIALQIQQVRCLAPLNWGNALFSPREYSLLSSF